MLTLTIRHERMSSLRRTRAGLTEAWRLLWQGTRGQRLRESWGVEHYIKALEVTHGENGWHPHLHVLVFHRGVIGDVDRRNMFEAWCDVVKRALGAAFVPDLAHGIDVRESRKDDYLAKLGLEVTSHRSKHGKKGNRHPWEIAKDAVAGDSKSRRLWQVYGFAMLGARQLTWSRGTRAFFSLRERDDDGVLAEDEVGTLVGCWTSAEWDARKSRDRRWLATVVSAMSSVAPIGALESLGAGAISRRGVISRRASAVQVDEWATNPARMLWTPPTAQRRRTAVTVFSEARREWSAIDLAQLAYRE